MVLANILYSTRFYVGVASEHRVQPIQITAWCMRGVYELNVRLRYTLDSDQNMRESISERATDELELVDAILKIPQADLKSPNTEDWVSDCEADRIASQDRRGAGAQPAEAPCGHVGSSKR